MKNIASVTSLGALLVALTASAPAAAQPSKAAPTTTTTKTAEYTETGVVGGDQIVKFTGDELVGPTGGAYGDIIRRPPGVVRVGLIRPRMNFVSELLKTVENL